MKIQAETMKRIFADMTAMWNAVPKAKQDEMREALASGNITITNLGWQLYHLAFADRNYDDSHPRYQTRARILPLAPFPMYPDGANDDHMSTMFKRFELPPVTPPVVIEAFTPADAYHTERFFQAESLHGSEIPPADEAIQQLTPGLTMTIHPTQQPYYNLPLWSEYLDAKRRWEESHGLYVMTEDNHPWKTDRRQAMEENYRTMQSLLATLRTTPEHLAAFGW